MLAGSSWRSGALLALACWALLLCCKMGDERKDRIEWVRAKMGQTVNIAEEWELL